MLKLGLLALAIGAVLPSASAQQQPSKMPSVYPSTPGTKSMFVYLPGQIAVASEGHTPSFDRKSAESLKQYCPGIRVLALPKEADYVIFYSEEWKRDLTAVRNDGEVVFAGNSFWEKKSVVAKACSEIMKDWKKHTTGSPNTGNP